MIGENGEMTYDAGDTGIKVFAIPTRDRDTLSPPQVFSIRGEEPSTKFYIRLDGEFVRKVEVDRGAWGEYSDNPDDVMDWQQIMMKGKFAGRAFVLHVEIKLNHQLEMTPWTREEEENNGNGTLNDIHINSSGVIGDMSNVFSSKAYGTICNSLIEYNVVLLHDHDKSVVNHTNIPTVIARIDKNILTLAGDLRDDTVLLTKHNTLDTQQNNHMSTGSIIPCSRDNSIEIDIVSGTSITGISLASCIESNDSDENTKENSLQLRIGLPSMDITSHNATNATSSPHATIMHCSRQATCVSIMPIMDVASNVNDSIYQDGERMPNELLRSSRLTSSYGSRSDNDTDIDWYSDNVYDTYIQIVLVVTLMISKVLDSENINTTYAAVLWNRNWKGIYNQQQWTQTPFDWYSKKQATADTATYGSEVFLVR